MKNMKKRIFCLVMAGVMLSLSISVSAANTSAADPFDHYDDFTIEDFAAMDDMTAEQNMIRYFQDQVDNSSYGGIYYDENGVLVVNIVREHYDEFSAVPTTFSDGTSVEYRVVEYSLQELETVKDTLAGYMNQYRIAMLDANEMTNQVDVALFNYDSNVRNEILSIAESIHPNIPINFIDYSDCTIQSTVAFEKPEYPADSNILDLDSASIQSDITVFSGQPIQMNGGYYTLGPITSSQTAFSAGHGVSITGTSVYTGFLKLIGIAHGYYGGRYGDWSRISLGSNVDTAVQHRTASPVMGQSVRMLGAVSGITNGSVSKTNIDVFADAPWANLTGMCSATYSCQRGDSGAAILLSNNSCVGIQSSATFDVNGNWSGVSYFTPADKFYL